MWRSACQRFSTRAQREFQSNRAFSFRKVRNADSENGVLYHVADTTLHQSGPAIYAGEVVILLRRQDRCHLLPVTARRGNGEYYRSTGQNNPPPRCRKSVDERERRYTDGDETQKPTARSGSGHRHRDSNEIQ